MVWGAWNSSDHHSTIVLRALRGVFIILGDASPSGIGCNFSHFWNDAWEGLDMRSFIGRMDCLENHALASEKLASLGIIGDKFRAPLNHWYDSAVMYGRFREPLIGCPWCPETSASRTATSLVAAVSDRWTVGGIHSADNLFCSRIIKQWRIISSHNGLQLLNNGTKCQVRMDYNY